MNARKSPPILTPENIADLAKEPGRYPVIDGLRLNVTPSGKPRWEVLRLGGGPDRFWKLAGTFPEVDFDNMVSRAKAALAIDEVAERAAMDLCNDDLEVGQVVEAAFHAFKAKLTVDFERGVFDPGKSSDQRAVYDEILGTLLAWLPDQEHGAQVRRKQICEEVSRRRNLIIGKGTAAPEATGVTPNGAAAISRIGRDAAAILNSMNESDCWKAYGLLVQMSKGVWPTLPD